MFHPQPSPYFSSYGATLDDVFRGFPPAGLRVERSGPSSVLREPSFGGVAASNLPTAFTTTIAITSPQHRDMAADGVSDVEAQEALARDFQPTLIGPLVGDRRSSHAITEEYAKADPVYVAKTAALPQKYSHYRPIMGDGNCGWRAAGYAYFESLLRLQSKAQIEGEIARMISLDNFLTTVGGFQAWLVEDMVEQTTILLRELANLVESSPRAAEQHLHQQFNNPEIGNAIIYHLRLLASSWLKGNLQIYQDFIPDNQGTDGYCKYLEAVNQEIDHLGMTLLIDVLLKPIGFSVEIVYLDRSEGSQANSHWYQNQDPSGLMIPSAPAIHLLYRPSHYDILYADVSPSVPLQDVQAFANPQINRATSFTQQHIIQSTPSAMGDFGQLDLATLLSIPGFSLPPQPSHHGFPAEYTSPLEHTYSASPLSTSVSPASPGSASTTNSATNLSTRTYSAQPPSPLVSNMISPNSSSYPPSTTQLPIHSQMPLNQRPPLSTHTSLSPHPLVLHSTLPNASDLSSPTSATSFRPSKYEWEAAADWQESQPITFQTSTFKNSHYNTAHYNNPQFQPEEWTPEQDEVPMGRKRSS